MLNLTGCSLRRRGGTQGVVPVVFVLLVTSCGTPQGPAGLWIGAASPPAFARRLLHFTVLVSF